MSSRRWLVPLAIGELLVLVIYVLDVVVDLELSGGVRTLARAAVLIGAVLIAGTCYHRWSTVDRRTPATHAMAVTALLGGALTASSAFQPSSGVYADGRTATLGTVALVIAVLAAQFTLVEKERHA